MYKKRDILKNKKGISPIIETLVTVGIVIVLLVIFYISAINIFTPHDNPAIDLNAKSIGLLESLTAFPGSGSGYTYEWQYDPIFVDFPGLVTTETLAYGLVQVDDEGTVNVIEYHEFSEDSIGFSKTCFLAGTKIVLSDGSYKNIEDIRTGDMVKSYDEKTGSIDSRQVTEIFHHSPEEMDDYYLLINNCLRVTPDHRFYSNGRWITAGDLKIGDPLFYTSSEYTVESVEKIFEKEPSYNFEVEGNHNYFVALDTSKALVHNQGPQLPSPVARFTWFDMDGPHSQGTAIFLNAEESTAPAVTTIVNYSWYFNWDYNKDGVPPAGSQDAYGLDKKYYSFDPGHSNPFPVTLRIKSSNNNVDYTTHIVQANQPTSYFIEEKPWVLTSKNIFPPVGNDTLLPYGGGYYIKYTPTILTPPGYMTYVFEIKDKNKPPVTIIDYGKFKQFDNNNIRYYMLKEDLGLKSTERTVYNFNISLEVDGEVLQYGANYDDVYAMESVGKDVLVYYKANYSTGEILKRPYYKKGRIIVSVFIGGKEPNYPPGTSRPTNPINSATDVRWNTNLRWSEAVDPNDDRVFYDVYFGKEEDYDEIRDLNQEFRAAENLTTSTCSSFFIFDPEAPASGGRILYKYRKYYWRVVARDIHGAETVNDIWHFTTEDNKPPNIPSNPTPVHTMIDFNVSSNLQWSCTDPNSGDRLRYNVSFGEEPLPNVVKTNLFLRRWDPKELPLFTGRLKYDTKFYWSILPRDLYNVYPLGQIPIWSFTTAEKGLDHYANYGLNDGEYITTPGIGQTFIAGKNGTLRTINLSIKNESSLGTIDVTIYTASIDDAGPPTLKIGSLLGKATLGSSDFITTDYEWKKIYIKNLADEEGIQVEKDQLYFIMLSANFDYSWEFGELYDDQPYPQGSAWRFTGGSWGQIVDEAVVKDFTFKTYVYRDFDPDANHQDTSSSSDYSFFTTNAQTFTAVNQGDLMKINLSLKNNDPDNTSNLIVRLYEGTTPPNNFLNVEPLAITTIEGFYDEAGDYTWRSAEFLFKPAYITQGETYCIVVTSANADYQWQKSPGYGGGTAYNFTFVVIPGDPPWEELTDDFLFEVYVDTEMG
jgi:hypothetical protein